MSRFDYLIIGNSAAAVGAVEAMRKAGADGSVAVVSDEAYHVYSRPMISDCVIRRADAESISYRPSDFYSSHKVTPVLGDLAVSIEPERKMVSLKNGKTLEYGSLLLTTGARPVKPPIPGTDAKGVHFFTTFGEANALAEDLTDVREAVVIGAGLIGLQAAEALCEVGIRVTVVEMLDRVLALAVDGQASSMIQAKFEEHGVSILTSCRVGEINKDGKGRVCGVVLSDGSHVKCQVVVVAAGVAPRTELAQSTGIRVNKGIPVDSLMRTSAPDIYAAGDVAEAYDLLLGENRLIPIWPNAYVEGRTAGLAMIGKPEEFRGEIAMNAAHFFGFSVISAGIIELKDDCREIVDADGPSDRYRRIILQGSVPVGMVMTGDAVDRAGLILSMIKNRTDTTPFFDKLESGIFNTAHLPDDLRRIKQLGREQI